MRRLIDSNPESMGTMGTPAMGTTAVAIVAMVAGAHAGFQVTKDGSVKACQKIPSATGHGNQLTMSETSNLAWRVPPCNAGASFL